MKTTLTLALLLCSVAVAGADTAPAAAPATASLEAQAPIALSGPVGGFDYLAADAANHHIFASHPGAKSVATIDTEAGTASNIEVGVEVNGIAVDKKGGKVYFAGGGGKLFAYDSKTLAMNGVLDLGGPADDIVLDPKTSMLYLDEDAGKHIWVVDTKTLKVTATIEVGGVPEFILWDKATDKIYQNIKTNDTLQVIDPATNTVTATWSTAPVKSPHGMAIDGKGGRIFTAGRNSLLAALDINTGKVIGTCEIAAGVDQITYDNKAKRVYCAGAGVVSVVDVADGGLKLIDKIQAGGKAHTLAVDAKTGNVWVAYPGTDKSYVQCLKTNAPRKVKSDD